MRGQGKLFLLLALLAIMVLTSCDLLFSPTANKVTGIGVVPIRYSKQGKLCVDLVVLQYRADGSRRISVIPIESADNNIFWVDVKERLIFTIKQFPNYALLKVFQSTSESLSSIVKVKKIAETKLPFEVKDVLYKDGNIYVTSFNHIYLISFSNKSFSALKKLPRGEEELESDGDLVFTEAFSPHDTKWIIYKDGKLLLAYDDIPSLTNTLWLSGSPDLRENIVYIPTKKGVLIWDVKNHVKKGFILTPSYVIGVRAGMDGIYVHTYGRLIKYSYEGEEMYSIELSSSTARMNSILPILPGDILVVDLDGTVVIVKDTGKGFKKMWENDYNEGVVLYAEYLER